MGERTRGMEVGYRFYLTTLCTLCYRGVLELWWQTPPVEVFVRIPTVPSFQSTRVSLSAYLGRRAIVPAVMNIAPRKGTCAAQHQLYFVLFLQHQHSMLMR